MLDFRSKQPTTRNYLARGEQRRMLGLVVMLGLFMFAMAESANPERWQWLWHMTEGRGQQLAAVDTRMPTDEDDRPLPLKPVEPVVAPPPLRWAGVEAGELATLVDDSKLRIEERPAVYQLLAKLSETDPAELKAAAIGTVTYIQLFKQAGFYRGQVVAMSGHAHSATRINTAAIPEAGSLDAFYELWVTPIDRPTEVVCLFCAELPEKFPTGRGLNEPVQFQGVSLKRLAYQAQDKDWHSTPLLVARGVEWRPVVAARAPPKPKARWIIPTVIVLGTIGLALGVAMWAFGNRSRPRNPYSATHHPSRRGFKFSDLRNLEVDPEARVAFDKPANVPNEPPHAAD